ncbi:MAG TPA: PAS domain-containing protein [Candidatus Angelobacter sp.]|nr:PAS domain-containing protein [Candidatus Angelobacter sp.]
MVLKQPNTQRKLQATPMPAAAKAEHALLQHKHLVETLLESTADFIYMKDRSGKYVFVNPAAAESLGKKPEEIIGQDDRALFPEQHARQIMEKDRQIMASGVSEVFEEDRSYSGGVRHLHSSKNVCRDSSGAVIGIVGISRDISEIKRAEEALNSSELNAAGARMANALAHEINNPLAALTNALFLLRQGNGSVPADQILVAAQEALWRITKITRQMIGLYNRTAPARHISVQDVVNGTLANLDLQITKKGIRMELDLSPCEFFGIDADLRQQITALMENAVEQAHGLVRIKLYNPTYANGDLRQEFRLVIADDGPGIAPEHRERIFEPFFSTKAEKGSGLGLWMARGIANKYGGRIRVRSRTAQGSSWACVVLTMPTKRTFLKREK